MAKINKDLTAEQNIAALIKESNPRFIYGLDTLTFGTPSPGPGEGYNTTIVATAKPNAAFVGNESYNYNRLDLADGGIDPALGTTLTVAEEDDEESIKGKALTYFRLLDTQVVFGEYVAATEEGNGLLEITAIEDSLFYIPSTAVIELVKSSEEPDALADLTDERNLNGFDDEFSVPVPEYVHDPVVEPTLVSSEETTPQGKLLNGTNNPSTDLTIFHNGEISLATSARIYQSTPTVAPSEGHYDVLVEDNKDWNFPILVALTNKTAGSVITDLYDVQFKIFNMQTEQRLTFKLVKKDDNSGYDWVDEVYGLRITDNTTTEDLAVVQNIQRLRFYAEQLGIGDFNGFGAALGQFELSFYAQRRDTYVDPITFGVTVNAHGPV